MIQLTIEEKYDNYLYTLRNCSSDVNQQTGERFLYTLFELLSIYVNMCFFEMNVEELKEAGFVDEDEGEKSKEIRVLFQKNEKVWFEIHDPERIKEHAEWKRVNQLADQVLASIGKGGKSI